MVFSGLAAAEPGVQADAKWSGFYAGVSAGAIFSQTQLYSQHRFFLSGSSPYSHDINTANFLPGVQAGYNHQFQSGLVLGGEAEFSYPNNNGQFTEKFQNQFDKFSYNNRLQGSLRTRLGFALDRFLPYLAVGVSFADTKFQYTDEVNDRYVNENVQVGWMLGGGLEYALIDKLSLRGEYLYTDYGRPSYTAIPTVVGVFDPAGVARTDLVSHSVRLALNYHF